MPSAPGSLRTLIHSTLGIKSLLKQEQLKHNVTDRDRVLVPPNWDSWAKIRILREGFDVEGISEKWSVDIDIPQHMRPTNGQAQTPGEDEAQATVEPSPVAAEEENEPSATSIYEEEIRNPESDYNLSSLSKQANGLEVSSKDPQAFLTDQVGILEDLRRHDENEAAAKAARKESDPSTARTWTDDASGVVEEHIGPVQFNMGGIQVNADEMVKRLQVRRKPLLDVCAHDTDIHQDRQANRSDEPETPPSKPQETNINDNEKLRSFFSSLVNKTPANSPRGA
jgi:dynein light intermediate chain 1